VVDELRRPGPRTGDGKEMTKMLEIFYSKYKNNYTKICNFNNTFPRKSSMSISPKMVRIAKNIYDYKSKIILLHTYLHTHMQ
jgi:hypothetical protein